MSLSMCQCGYVSSPSQCIAHSIISHQPNLAPPPTHTHAHTHTPPPSHIFYHIIFEKRANHLSCNSTRTTLRKVAWLVWFKSSGAAIQVRWILRRGVEKKRGIKKTRGEKRRWWMALVRGVICFSLSDWAPAVAPSLVLLHSPLLGLALLTSARWAGRMDRLAQEGRTGLESEKTASNDFKEKHSPKQQARLMHH